MRFPARATAGLIGFFCLAACLSVPAQAEWLRAESDHFIIYADDKVKDVEKFSQMLERYHSAMALLLPREVPKPSPSARLTIFVVGSAREISKLAGSSRVAGFYTPRASGSFAFVPDVSASTRELDFSMIVLLHEYTHHYLISSTVFAWPKWVDEGAAEFFASAQFPSDGGVKIGLPAMHRSYELSVIDDVPIRELLAPDDFSARNPERYDAFYGRAWTLYHFLTFSQERKGQLSAYLRAISAGAGSLEAANAVFGDLDRLDRELDSYLRQSRMTSLNLPADWIKPGPTTITTLSAGMNAVLPLKIRSKRGVDEEEALAILPEIRAVAERFPDDPGVLEALAEAEYDAGNDEQAIAAADRALALDASAKNALVQKGYAMFRLAEAADREAIDEAFSAAMKPFQALNALETDHPLPLIYYYRSFSYRGESAPELARHALERASQLAPFDQGLSLEVAHMLAYEGKIGLARVYLERLAADPHRGGPSQLASRLLGSLDGVEEGTSTPLVDNKPEMELAAPLTKGLPHGDHGGHHAH